MSRCGWSLSDQGLKLEQRNERREELFEGLSLRCDTEADVFKACGIPYRAPHERELEVEEAVCCSTAVDEPFAARAPSESEDDIIEDALAAIEDAED